MKTAILIIAAGSSSRLGQLKQLVSYQGTCLLDYIIEQCGQSRVGDVFVVLGAQEKIIAPRIVYQNITIFCNSNWFLGMGTSIACGILNIKHLGYENVIIMLGDQPFFKSDILKEIIKTHQKNNARIIVSKYEKGIGPPTFFDVSLFDELAELQGDIGAKPIIKKYFREVVTIPFPKGYIDIDTPVDLKYLNKVD